VAYAAMCFQAAGLYSHGVTDRLGNIRLPLEIMGYSKAYRRRVVRQVAGAGSELAGSSASFLGKLSEGGCSRGILIARALAFDADILLMDEPFWWLDEIVRDHLNERFASVGRARKRHSAFCHPLHTRGVYLSTKKSW